jgi:hypothetical protein
MAKKKPDWPDELKEPFPFGDPLVELDRRLSINGSSADQRVQVTDAEAKEVRAFAAEVNRRASIMARFLGWGHDGRLESKEDWERFLVRLCRHWKIRGFHERTGGGRPKKWTNELRQKLVADVQSLMEQGNGRIERIACGIIAGNPQKYLERYRDKDSTLYREFRRSKELLGKQLRSARARNEWFEFLRDHISAAAVTEKLYIVLDALRSSPRSEEFERTKKVIQKHLVHASDSNKVLRIILDK